MTWECVEISYDGESTPAALINDVPLIDATNYPPSTTYPGSTFAHSPSVSTQYHGPARQVWYDDVVVAPHASAAVSR